MRTKANSCTGKVRHANRCRTIRVLKKLNNAGLSGYRCGYCHGWHIGNHPKKIQDRIDQLLQPKK